MKKAFYKQLCRRCGLILLALSMLLTLFGCTKAENDADLGYMENMADAGNMLPQDGEYDTTANENGTPILVENPFITTQEEPISTFSADVDTASYTYFRKLVTNNYSLDDLKSFGANFRTEEFINYFKYQANAPKEGELFGVTTAIAPCPWNSQIGRAHV